ncbi:MAG: sulfur carrier protein ThiS [bacterium]|nr:sulfur carrier protein ThiS [bacterium]
MKITLNNKDTEVNGYEIITIKELLKVMKFTFPMTVVRVNEKLVKKASYKNVTVKPGDHVIAIPLVGGG